MNKINKIILLMLGCLALMACTAGDVLDPFTSAPESIPVNTSESPISVPATAVLVEDEPAALPTAILTEINEAEAETNEESEQGETDTIETVEAETPTAEPTAEVAVLPIVFNGNDISFDGDQAVVDGQTITIRSAGTYSLSGVLNDGQIIVDSQDDEVVTLILNGVDVTNTTGAPIFISNAEETIITLVAGSENRLVDGATYTFASAEIDEPNGALFSEDDLIINGTGTLVVNGNFNHGIVSKDDLTIMDGTILVTAVNDGIKGRDSIVILAGTITVDAAGDGLQSNNDVDPERGTVLIEGGSLNITAGTDGIQAETILTITGGEIVVDAGKNSGNGTESGKGLKAGLEVAILDGLIDVTAVDDSIHANDSIMIAGGGLTLASNDDGIHADAMITINGGDIQITNSYEGIESKVILVNGGTIHLNSSDDGINIATSEQTGRGAVADAYLEINSGYLVVNAGGDGLDSNGSIVMNGGTVLVHGPTADFNAALDYDGSFEIHGGYLTAAGSERMSQAPSTESTQYAVLVTLPSWVPGGTLVNIQDSVGNSVLTFMPQNEYKTIALSSSALQNGESYTVYTGGNASGTLADGLYSDGTYSAGTAVSTFTISSIITGERAQGGRGR